MSSRPCLPSRWRNTNSRAPSLRGRYPASTLLRAPPPPSRRQPTSRGRRLYGLPSFRRVRGGARRASTVARCALVTVPSLPPRRSVPPRQPLRRSVLPSPYGWGLGLRGFAFSGPPLRSLSLRPGDSPTIPWMAVSMGFRTVGFPPACHPSYGGSALPPAGLTPAEHISLIWTHNRSKPFPAAIDRACCACGGRRGVLGAGRRAHPGPG